MITKEQVEAAYIEMERVKDEAMKAGINLGIRPGDKFADSTFSPLSEAASRFEAVMAEWEKENPPGFFKRWEFSWKTKPPTLVLR